MQCIKNIQWYWAWVRCKTLMGSPFHGLHKQLHDSMCYLYDDMRVTYPQLMATAHKTESLQEDHPREIVWLRSAQAEGKDDIIRLSEQIAQLQLTVQKPQKTTASIPWQWGSERDGNGNECDTRGKVKIKTMARDVTARGLNVFDVWTGYIALMCAHAPL